jgi:alpha-beta hydrolase superfamily lysophospholipase
MKLETYELTSHMDGLGLSTLLAIPDGEAKGIVQLVHGMAEHKERYVPFMKFLCEHGYVCVIHDHRGHGDSVRSKDDYGYFYENGKEAIVQDVYQVTNWIKEKYPNLKLYLFGHSMGSLIVRCYTKKYDADIDGLIVCGSPSNNKAAGAAVALAKAMILVKGDHAAGNLLQKMGLGHYNDDFDADFSPNDWISENRENVIAYDADPKCGFIFTLNGFLNLFLLVQDTYSEKGWECHHPRLPVFFLSGEEDPCMGSREEFEDAIRFMRKVGYRDTKAKIYPGMRHEILNEEDREQVYEDVLTLLQRWKN